jgi:hypothetical protein
LVATFEPNGWKGMRKRDGEPRHERCFVVPAERQLIMKPTLHVLVAIALGLSLVACGGHKDPETPEPIPGDGPAEEAGEAADEAAEEAADEAEDAADEVEDSAEDVSN